MQTLDMQYLSTHPEGEEKAVFTSRINIPEKYGIPLNRDGSRPQVSLSVTSDTYGTALGVLTELNGRIAELGYEWLERILSEEEMAILNELPEGAEPPDFLFKVQTAGEEFLTFTTEVVTVALAPDGSETDEEETTSVTITGPTVAIGMNGFRTLTGSNALTQLAISFSPETDDDDEDGYGEVLIRR